MSDKDKKSGESYDDKEALRFHAEGKPGKIAISAILILFLIK